MSLPRERYDRKIPEKSFNSLVYAFKIVVHSSFYPFHCCCTQQLCYILWTLTLDHTFRGRWFDDECNTNWRHIYDEHTHSIVPNLCHNDEMNWNLIGMNIFGKTFRSCGNDNLNHSEIQWRVCMNTFSLCTHFMTLCTSQMENGIEYGTIAYELVLYTFICIHRLKFCCRTWSNLPKSIPLLIPYFIFKYSYIRAHEFTAHK